ncbi:MAG: nitrilase-related carbon-nitrogen hydrolase, partial [Steroidobacteraceae bacterium]
MLVAAIQMTSTPDVAVNLADAGRLLAEAAAAGARVAVLPENFAIMGRREADKLAVAEAPGDGPIQAALAGAAMRLGLWIVGGTVPLRVPGDTRAA